MKLQVQIVKNHDEYVNYYRKLAEIEDEFLKSQIEKVEMEISYSETNILDEVINGYRIMDFSESDCGIESILIYTDLQDFSVDYDKNVIKELNRIIELKNKRFNEEYGTKD